MNHLDWYQCDKLKDLGFPQDASFLVRVLHYTTTPDAPLMTRYEFEKSTSKSTLDALACPTLEELIEWLPIHIPSSLNKNEWCYFSLGLRNNECSAEYSHYQHNEEYETGKTPLEAVYNLAVEVKGEK